MKTTEEQNKRIQCSHIEHDGHRVSMVVRFGDDGVLVLCELCAARVRVDVLKKFFADN